MILFLANCSLTKAEGGTAAYDKRLAIAPMLSAPLRNRFLDCRRQVLEVVNTGTVQWHGSLLKDLDFNRGLVCGADLGGRRTGAFRPAIERYDGRFFQALGSAGRSQLVSSPHHTLFLSGLYGLLRPLEPIQRYSCPMAAPVAAKWLQGSLLTDVLCAYVEQFDIVRIIDLAAIDDYRALIDWQRIAEQGIDVLHCFDVMAPGDYALTSFGKCLASSLLDWSADELAALEPERCIDTVMFRSLGAPLQAAPAVGWYAHAEQPRQPPAEQPSQPPAAPGGSKPFWKPNFNSQCCKDIHKNFHMFTRVMQATVEVCSDPTTPRGSDTVKKLQGTHDLWRYRIGTHRLIYRTIVPQGAVSGIVLFEHFGARGDIYKRL